MLATLTQMAPRREVRYQASPFLTQRLMDVYQTPALPGYVNTQQNKYPLMKTNSIQPNIKDYLFRD